MKDAELHSFLSAQSELHFVRLADASVGGARFIQVYGIKYFEYTNEFCVMPETKELVVKVYIAIDIHSNIILSDILLEFG